jgi:pimeloyl-ACP methyl ester carboxylesterase
MQKLSPKTFFEPLLIETVDGSRVSGIQCTPHALHATDKHKPLLVLLHGGRCHAHYFNLDDEHTIAAFADTFATPTVAIDRPCYGQTTTIVPVPPHSTFHRETGRLLHEQILPALWQKYGVTNSCTGLVVMAHSLGVPGLINAASLYSVSKESSRYPLAGLILSGWGTRQHEEHVKQRLSWDSEQIRQNRKLMMLNLPASHDTDSAFDRSLDFQTVSGPVEEAAELANGTWASYWAESARSINVPIMYALAEHDWLWHGTEEHVEEFRSYFPNSPNFESRVVLGAPHAIEWTQYSKGWYARCFAFAIDAVLNLG